jgi:hypothetical protein
MALGQPYASKPRPSNHTPAESTPPDIELGGVEAGPNRHENSAEYCATLDAHERASKLAARVGSNPANKSTINSSNFTDSDFSSQNIEGVVVPPPQDTTKQEKEGEQSVEDVLYQRNTRRRAADHEREAQELVGNHSKAHAYYDADETPLHSGQVTPAPELRAEVGYIQIPRKLEAAF